MRTSRCRRLVGLLLAVALSGCRSTALPNLLHPGPIEDQQYAAEKSGDQPPQDFGSPGADGNGMMPPGYIPRAEVQQSRNVRPNPAFQPAPSYYQGY